MPQLRRAKGGAGCQEILSRQVLPAGVSASSNNISRVPGCRSKIAACQIAACQIAACRIAACQIASCQIAACQNAACVKLLECQIAACVKSLRIKSLAYVTKFAACQIAACQIACVSNRCVSKSLRVKSLRVKSLRVKPLHIRRRKSLSKACQNEKQDHDEIKDSIRVWEVGTVHTHKPSDIKRIKRPPGGMIMEESPAS